VDNGPGKDWAKRIKKLAENFFEDVHLFTGQGNVGYGMGHNLSLKKNGSEYHLVLNPDVYMGKEALDNSLKFMKKNPQVGMITPFATNGMGQKEYLCKRYPRVSVLLLRSFAPDFLKKRFRDILFHYEMRDMIRDHVILDIPLASGAFMFFRRELVQRIGGFSKDFFMYFEDFDLCMRLRETAKIAYVPNVKIAHLGGNASGNGLRHIYLFSKSAFTFFSRYGWSF
jgi:GT2 family glycosyltransferase